MIVIVGLAVLLVAVIVGFTGVLTNAGPTHVLTESFSVLGYHVTGSTGTLFLFGIMIGAVAMLGLSVLLAGARRTAGRGRDARHELENSQRETDLLNRDRDQRLERQSVGAATGSPVNARAATTRRNRVPLFGPWSRGRFGPWSRRRQPARTSTAPARQPTPSTENEGIRNEHR
jgi:hypothetical protein